MKRYSHILKDLLEYSNETEWIEFKENFVNHEEIGEYISALSNAAALWEREYAYLVWGIKDKTKEVVGTKFNHRSIIEKSNEVLEHYLARNLSPSIHFRFIEVTHDNKKVVILEIPKAHRIPTAFKNERYLRIDSSKVNIKKYPEREIDLFDALREEETIVTKEAKHQKLTFNKLFVFYASKGIILNKDTFEENLELKTKAGKYNILAQLLSDDNKIPFRIATYNGRAKVDKMVGVRDFGNTCLLYAFNDVLAYGNVINKVQSSDDGQIPRVDTPYFDHNIFSEALVNAFVHNDWLYEESPQIDVFSNRLEIISHGGIPRNQTIENFYRGVSKLRNKALAEIFMQLRISEKIGRGVPRIVSKYGKEAFAFSSSSLIVTIPFNIVSSQSINLSIKEQLNEYVLSIRERQIIDIIKDDPNVTIRVLSTELSVSATTIEKYLAQLKNAYIIDRVGSKKAGYWVVNEGY